MINLSEVESLLITGTNGFVGRSIIDQITKVDSQHLPHELLLVTRQGLDFDLPINLRAITTVLNQDLKQKWKFGKEVSHIINLAADGSRSPYSTAANNTFTSIVANLVSWVSTFQKSPRVFHASSGACSGFRPLSGSSASFNPKSSFAQNRLEAELALKKASSDFGFELSIGRLYSFSGVHLLGKDQYVISDFIKSAIATNAIKILGNPNTVRSFLHQDAMANWVLQALICKKPDTSLEIGSSEMVTIRELAEFVAQETSVSISFPTEVHQGDIYLPNNQETKDKLGVTEGKSWKIAVKEMIKVEGKKFHGTL
jgi:nucleoside-diphosphate-sugar epimerase